MFCCDLVFTKLFTISAVLEAIILGQIEASPKRSKHFRKKVISFVKFSVLSETKELLMDWFTQWKRCVENNNK